MKVYAGNEPRIGKIRTVIGCLLTNHGFYFCRDAAHCGELPINVERPLQHIYELSAWLVTKDCHKTDELPEHAVPCLDVRSPDVNFLRKVSSGSKLHGHGSSCHPWQHPPVANVLFAPPCFSTLFEKISPPPDKHPRKDIPSAMGVLRFGKLKKTVAPAGYKNKQCRKQTSVP